MSDREIFIKAFLEIAIEDFNSDFLAKNLTIEDLEKSSKENLEFIAGKFFDKFGYLFTDKNRKYLLNEYLTVELAACDLYHELVGNGCGFGDGDWSEEVEDTLEKKIQCYELFLSEYRGKLYLDMFTKDAFIQRNEWAK